MWYFYSALQSALDLKRICGHCRHTQRIALESRDKLVACKRCGSPITPPKI